MTTTLATLDTEITDPEIRRSSLAGVILRMKSLKLPDVREFPFLSPPSPKAISEGHRTLEEVGAMEKNGSLTRVGRQLARLPLDPRLGRMLIEAQRRKVLDAVLSHNDNYPYIRGIIASVGLKKVIIPCTWKARKRGVSKHNLMMLIDQALNAIFAFTKAPMRFCTLVGSGIDLIT